MSLTLNMMTQRVQNSESWCSLVFSEIPGLGSQSSSRSSQRVPVLYSVMPYGRHLAFLVSLQPRGTPKCKRKRDLSQILLQKEILL